MAFDHIFFKIRYVLQESKERCLLEKKICLSRSRKRNYDTKPTCMKLSWFEFQIFQAAAPLWPARKQLGASFESSEHLWWNGTSFMFPKSNPVPVKRVSKRINQWNPELWSSKIPMSSFTFLKLLIHFWSSKFLLYYAHVLLSHASFAALLAILPARRIARKGSKKSFGHSWSIIPKQWAEY